MEKELRKLREQIRRDAVMVPFFIDKKKAIDRYCFELGVMVFECIDRLVVMNVLTSRKIGYISNDIDKVLNEMTLSSSSITLLYYNYLEDILKGYLRYCEDEELWEVASNLNKFYENLYKQKLSKEDE